MAAKNLVILIFPKINYEENYRYSWTPFSILALAGVLEQKGFVPILFDQNLDPEANWFSKIEPYLDESICVGFSVMTGGGQIQNALGLAAQIREYAPSLPLVWGGPHVSVLPQQTIEHPLVDLAVVGQGDITMVELTIALQRNKSLEDIPGIYISEQGKTRVTEPRSLIRKNELPTYPWHLIEPAHYVRDDATIGTKTFGYISSQGCPYRCRFCYEFGAYNAWWSGFDSGRLTNDIQGLIDNYQIDGVKFYDADFFVNLGRIGDFCRWMKEKKLPIKWAGSAHPNDILHLYKKKPDLFDAIRETNCTRILIGMESGNDKMLELIDKRVTSKQLKEVVQIITDHGIIGSFTFIVGFPGESVNDLQDTLDLIEYIHYISARHETRIHIFAPYPGTPLYQMALNHGFKPPNEFQHWSDYNYYQPQTPWLDPAIVKIVNRYTKMHQ